jgi:hypothetical protein
VKKLLTVTGVAALAVLLTGTLGAPRSAAQDPILTPIIASEATAIVVGQVKAKPKSNKPAKFEGNILHANAIQMTVRAKDNEMAVQTFSLSQTAAAKMQEIIAKGGYQYGDKVTIYYDPQSLQVLKFKGKPSRPL